MRRRCAQRCRNHRHTRSGRASFTCQPINITSTTQPSIPVSTRLLYSCTSRSDIFWLHVRISLVVTTIMTRYYPAGEGPGDGAVPSPEIFSKFSEWKWRALRSTVFQVKMPARKGLVIFFAFTGTTCYNLTTIVLWPAVGTIPLLRTHLCVSNICLPLLINTPVYTDHHRNSSRHI